VCWGGEGRCGRVCVSVCVCVCVCVYVCVRVCVGEGREGVDVCYVTIHCMTRVVERASICVCSFKEGSFMCI